MENRSTTTLGLHGLAMSFSLPQPVNNLINACSSSLNSPGSLRLLKTPSETPQSFDCLRLILKTHSLGDCSETSSLLGVYCSLETNSL